MPNTDTKVLALGEQALYRRPSSLPTVPGAWAFVAACAVVLSACSDGGPPPAGKTAPSDPCEKRDDGWFCEGNDALQCKAGKSEQSVTCQDGAMCKPGRGCTTCAPNTRECDEATLRLCKTDGSGWKVLETCEDGTQCTLAGCDDLCARAAKERSYIGCEYWPVTLSNEGLDAAFEPAVAVGNPNLQTTHVTLERGDFSMAVDVAPGEVEVVSLPFEANLKDPFASVVVDGGTPSQVDDTTQPRSVLVEGGAYHLTSDSPVTVHQFNPLEYKVDGPCVDSSNREPDDPNHCFSYTNDASLLLPTTAMTGNYMAITRPTISLYRQDPQGTDIFNRAQVPGFVAIVGTQPEPTDVTVRVHAYTAASAAHSAQPFDALAPGDSLTVQLGAGDVLQLASAGASDACPVDLLPDTQRKGWYHCDLGADYDLTGTEIEASAPVAVLAGHDCALVPFDRWACDHLEESMFPLESWGDQLVVTLPNRKDSDAYRIKVLSATDGNRVSVQPPLDQDVVLDRGESFEWESSHHIIVEGSAPLTVAQFLLGQGGGMEPGDPSMSLAIPSDQFKRSYAILTPDTYDEVYVNLVSKGSSLMLDGYTVALTAIGSSDFRVARQKIDTAGLHTIEGGALVGVVVYGFGEYTSYMVPGGLDLNLLQPAPF